MRTTLNIDEDIVLVTRQLAKQRGETIGTVISDLVRQALQPGKAVKVRNGVPLFEPKAGLAKPGLDLVNKLRDAE